MKVIFLLSALTFSLLLAYLTHPGKRDGKSFLVFHSIQVFFFLCFLTFLPFTLTKAFFCSMDTRVSEQIIQFLFAEWKEKIHDTLKTKSLVFIVRKVDIQKLVDFSENINIYGCHGNLCARTLRASVFQFFLCKARA